VWELQTAIEGAHRVARETLKQSQKRMKRDYDVKELKLGDLVYQLDTATVLGPLWNLAVLT
jgi:regulatory protein YycI of two-component signal transduction system YycFG